MTGRRPVSPEQTPPDNADNASPAPPAVDAEVSPESLEKSIPIRIRPHLGTGGFA